MKRCGLISAFRYKTGMGAAFRRQQVRLPAPVSCLSSGARVIRQATDVGYDGASAFRAMVQLTLGVSPGRFSLRAF
ncbi:MAG: hypothetical protein ACO33A_06340 [Hyphomonas sp.]